jgi:Raf kinase inhibitor-like YbhB/YbcL family protein
MVLKLTSPSYSGGSFIPEKHTCDGKDISPPLEWSDVPAGTRSFAIIFEDPDASAKTWVHWVLYNIPADQRKLEENISSLKTLPTGAKHGINDFNKISYNGPCPPGGTHRYVMKLYALDKALDLDPGAGKTELLQAMDGHILDQAELVAKYKRAE